MTNEEFDACYARYNYVIQAIARKYGKTNDTLVEELYQEGLIALWRCEPSNAQTNVDAFIRQAIKFRIIDYLRKHAKIQHASLEDMMAHGSQLVEGEGGPALVTWTTYSAENVLHERQKKAQNED